MASPQKELGHIEIANDIVEKLYSSHLSGSEFMIILFVIRRTWGWNKKEDQISISQVVTETTLARKTICECLNKLVTKRLLFKREGNVNTLCFNKNYDEWLVTKRTLGSYQKVTIQVVTKTTPKVVTKTTLPIYIKDNKDNKDTNVSLTNGQKKEKTSVKKILSYFGIKFEEKYSNKYFCNFPKDTPLVKKLLDVHSEQRIKELIDIYFSSNDEFINKATRSIGVFYSVINKLVTIKPKVYKTKADEDWLDAVNEKRAEYGEPPLKNLYD